MPAISSRAISKPGRRGRAFETGGAGRCLLLPWTALVVTACGTPEPPNVVLIVIDTLRADRVGALGNPRKFTPAIDAVAARGTVFKRAYAQSSWTNASVASLLTSRYQSQHGVLDFSSMYTESHHDRCGSRTDLRRACVTLQLGELGVVLR